MVEAEQWHVWSCCFCALQLLLPPTLLPPAVFCAVFCAGPSPSASHCAAFCRDTSDMATFLPLPVLHPPNPLLLLAAAAGASDGVWKRRPGCFCAPLPPPVPLPSGVDCAGSSPAASHRAAFRFAASDMASFLPLPVLNPTNAPESSLAPCDGDGDGVWNCRADCGPVPRRLFGVICAGPSPSASHCAAFCRDTSDMATFLPLPVLNPPNPLLLLAAAAGAGTGV